MTNSNKNEMNRSYSWSTAGTKATVVNGCWSSNVLSWNESEDKDAVKHTKQANQVLKSALCDLSHTRVQHALHAQAQSYTHVGIMPYMHKLPNHKENDKAIQSVSILIGSANRRHGQVRILTIGWQAR